MTCSECGYTTKTASEYHPYAFCVLVKARLDPWQVVAEAMPYAKSRDIRRPDDHARHRLLVAP